MHSGIRVLGAWVSQDPLTPTLAPASWLAASSLGKELAKTCSFDEAGGVSPAILSDSPQRKDIAAFGDS